MGLTLRAKRICCLSAIALLVLLGLLCLAFGDPADYEDGVIIFFHGTLFGQTSVAAAWCALGPFSLARRLALSSAWLAVTVIALGFNRGLENMGPDNFNALFTFGLVVLTQFSLLSAPLAAITASLGIRLVSDATCEPAPERADRQIGIREAMIVTGIVAAVFGAARFKYGGLEQVNIEWDMVREFGYLTASNAVLALPLVFGILSQRRIWPICGALTLVVLGTAAELYLLPFIWDVPASANNGRIYWFVSLINVVQAGWLVGLLFLVRLGGFSLTNRAAAVR